MDHGPGVNNLRLCVRHIRRRITRCNGHGSFSFLASPKSLDEGVVTRNDEDAQRGRNQHPPEHAGAHHILRSCSCAASYHERNDAKDERKGGHENRAEAQFGRGKSGILEAKTLFVFCFGELDNQDGVFRCQSN